MFQNGESMSTLILGRKTVSDCSFSLLVMKTGFIKLFHIP